MTQAGADGGAGEPSVSDRARARSSHLAEPTNSTDRGHGPPCDAPTRPGTRESSLFRLFLGGAAGTGALAVIVFVVEPMITGQNSVFAGIIGADVRSPHGIGLIAFHIFNGSVTFPLGFAFLSARLPGP